MKVPRLVDCAGTGKSTVCPRTGSRRTRSPLPLTARRRERQWRAPIGGSGATAGAALTRSIGTSGEPAQPIFSKQLCRSNTAWTGWCCAAGEKGRRRRKRRRGRRRRRRRRGSGKGRQARADVLMLKCQSGFVTIARLVGAEDSSFRKRLEVLSHVGGEGRLDLLLAQPKHLEAVAVPSPPSPCPAAFLPRRPSFR